MDGIPPLGFHSVKALQSKSTLISSPELALQNDDPLSWNHYLGLAIFFKSQEIVESSTIMSQNAYEMYKFVNLRFLARPIAVAMETSNMIDTIEMSKFLRRINEQPLKDIIFSKLLKDLGLGIPLVCPRVKAYRDHVFSS